MKEAKRSEQCKGQDKDDGDTNKSKADMKRERREKQEAQRAAKEQSKLEVISKKSEVKTIDKAVASESNTGDSNKKVRNPASTSRSKAKSNKNSDQQCSDHQKANRQGELFPDIPKREIDPSVLTESIGYSGIHLHPDIVRVGLQMNANRIVDSTSRCLATLCALKSVIDHHDVVAGSATKSMLHDLKLRFDVITEFLTRCRPLNVSLRNVLRIVRTQLSRVSGELTVDQAKQSLIDLIDRFIHEEIECGLDGIKEHGSQKIHDGDVILVFNNSFLVRHVLGQALSDGKQFKVIVVDANPRREGRKMLQYLVNLGVDTTYVLINAVAHVMKGVS